ncbi:MAG: hypothetical protein R3303_06825 [Marinobacter sp.]|nr:hypothetical protein [Marinobacter sp.]
MPKRISEMRPDPVDELIRQEGLPEVYRETVDQYIRPLAQRIARWRSDEGRAIIVGVNGAQGTGKSTLVLFLQALLVNELDCPCARLSIDDLYLKKAERQGLADNVHPLLATRGVPGTHDLLLGQQVLDRLLAAADGDETPLPAFDKATDDRLPRPQWPVHHGPASVVLFEGWCVGAMPDTDAEHLRQPLNELERYDDADGYWRAYVNDQLRDAYGWFFDQIDRLVMLKAPSMDCVIEWRTLQEHKLAQRSGVAPEQSGEPSGVMSDEAIRRFVMHYERLTRRMLVELPEHADAIFFIDAQHRISSMRSNEQSSGDWRRLGARL